MRNQDIRHGILMSSLYFLSHFINLGHSIFKLSIWHVTDTLPGFGPLLGVLEAPGKNFSKPGKIERFFIIKPIYNLYIDVISNVYGQQLNSVDTFRWFSISQKLSNCRGMSPSPAKAE